MTRVPEPLVSVVLATYNGGAFLDEAIRSVLAQTYRNLELIVVDDGSTDGTAALMKSYAHDRRVRYLYQRNAGQPAADNRGILLARGALIAFIDSDDVWLSEKLAQQVPAFDDPAVGVAYSPSISINERGERVPMWPIPRFSGAVTERLFVQNFVPFSASIVRRECFERIGFFDTTLKQSYDYDLWLRMSTAYRFALCPEPAIYLRAWPGQMSNNFRVRYDAAIHVMKRFETTYPAALSVAAAREGWAHTFAGRAHFAWKYERSRWKAVVDYLRALRVQPLYVPALKGVVEALVR
jgi:glycosyltransferase involved in cell wall biosynthesis